MSDLQKIGKLLAQIDTGRSSKAGSVVYFIQVGDDGPVKIGISTNVKRRISSLQMASPYPLNLLACMWGGAEQEAELHQRFQKYWLRGEWFRPAPALMKYIAGILGGEE